MLGPDSEMLTEIMTELGTKHHGTVPPGDAQRLLGGKLASCLLTAARKRGLNVSTLLVQAILAKK
jgi:hypothetical protein